MELGSSLSDLCNPYAEALGAPLFALLIVNAFFALVGFVLVPIVKARHRTESARIAAAARVLSIVHLCGLVAGLLVVGSSLLQLLPSPSERFPLSVALSAFAVPGVVGLLSWSAIGSVFRPHLTPGVLRMQGPTGA